MNAFANVAEKIIKDSSEEVLDKEIFESNRNKRVLEYVSSNDSVFLKRSEEDKNFEGDLQVDNVHSKYIGRHIIRTGDSPQRISRTPDPISEAYHLNKELFNEAGVYVEKNVVMSGCFKSNKVTLQKTMIPDVKTEMSGLPSMKKIKVFKNCVKNTIRKLKIEQLHTNTVDDISNLSFNQKTFPGFHLNAYFNFRNKGESYKRDYNFEYGEVISSRAVHMPEFFTELNSSVWTEQITNGIREKNRGPIYIGNFIVTYERLVKDIKEKKFCGEGDWKRFDIHY